MQFINWYLDIVKRLIFYTRLVPQYPWTCGRILLDRISEKMRKRINKGTSTGFDQRSANTEIVYWSSLSRIIIPHGISRAHCRINISPPRGRLSGIATRASERAAVKVSRTLSGFGSSRAAAPASDSPANHSKKRECLSNALLIPACPDDHPAMWLSTLGPQRAEGHGVRWPARKITQSVVIEISLIRRALESSVGDFLLWEMSQGLNRKFLLSLCLQ